MRQAHISGCRAHDVAACSLQCTAGARDKDMFCSHWQLGSLTPSMHAARTRMYAWQATSQLMSGMPEPRCCTCRYTACDLIGDLLGCSRVWHHGHGDVTRLHHLCYGLANLQAPILGLLFMQHGPRKDTNNASPSVYGNVQCHIACRDLWGIGNRSRRYKVASSPSTTSVWEKSNLTSQSP